MPYLKLDDNFAHHPKIERLSAEAFQAHVTALLECARLLTDGLVSRAAARRAGATDAVLAELMADPPAGCSTPLWEEHPDGYRIPSYLDHNRSKVEVEEDRAEARDRQRRYRNAIRKNKKRGRNGVSHAVTDGVTDGVTSPVSHNPHPSPTPPPPKGEGVGASAGAGCGPRGPTGPAGGEAERPDLVTRIVKAFPMDELQRVAVTAWAADQPDAVRAAAKAARHHGGPADRQARRFLDALPAAYRGTAPSS